MGGPRGSGLSPANKYAFRIYTYCTISRSFLETLVFPTGPGAPSSFTASSFAYRALPERQ